MEKQQKNSLNKAQGKILLVVLGVFIVLFSSSFASATYCYQESANTSNQSGTDGNCGLNYSGSYAFVTTGAGAFVDPHNINYSIDGLFDTEYTEFVIQGGAYSEALYINYTKPVNTKNASWNIDMGDSLITNETIPQDCLNYSYDKLLLRAYGTNGISAGAIVASCYNGTTWNGLRTATLKTTRFYEEGIFWDVQQVIEGSNNYNATAVSTSAQSFIENLSYNPNLWLDINTFLVYNGTSYLTTKNVSGNNVIFNTTIYTPYTTTSTNYTFYWNISLTNTTGTFYQTLQNYTQLVTPLTTINITVLDCGAGFYPAFNFSFFNETSLASINATSVNYNLQYGAGNNLAFVSNGSISDVHTFRICINATSQYYVGYGEVEYEVAGYSARRFYIFNNTRLTNTSISNNLYALDYAISTPFQITATSTSLAPYTNHYISLLRWYPNLNQYNIVEMSKTDDNGQSVVNVKTNDVDYRLGLYASDGTLIKLLDPIRMVCQTNPCVYSIITTDTITDLTEFMKVQQDLSFNSTTKIYTFTWNDPSQNTDSMRLLVFNDFPDKNSTVICNQTANGFTGIMVCNVSGYSGTIRAEAWRTASPPNLIAQVITNIRSAFKDLAGGSPLGLFFGFLLVVTFALIGTVSPVMVVILSLVALIPMVILGNISFGVAMIIGALGGLILHFLRRSSGN